MKTGDRITLPSEHKNLVSSLTGLPPVYLISLRQCLTDDQSQQWKIHQAFWQWVAVKIDYLQRESLGYILPDPFESPLLHPSQKAYYNIAANTLFAELNLMIAGWDLIKSAAFENQKEFVFANPRELCTEYCAKKSILSTQLFLSNGINQGETLGMIRESYQNVSAFYREKIKLQEESYTLQAYLNYGDWLEFTIYAIWKHRENKKFNQGKLKQAWENYLRSFKSEFTMICQKDYFKKHNSRITTLKWTQGNAAHTKDCRRAKWENL